MMSRCTCLLVFALAACKSDASDGPGPRKDKPVESTQKLAGVWPDKFQCNSIASVEELALVLGGTVRQMDNPASVPRGVAHPCVFEVPAGANDAGVTQFAYWTFDFDCRDNYKQTADALFAQYRRQNSDLIAHYDSMADAGALPTNDAGIASVRPGESADVDVGAKALDHHGQGLLFIDDDAPCYVRVVGPDGGRRLELAKLIAKNLTYMNAPMVPRTPQ